MNYKEVNKEIWNKKVDENYYWTRPVTSEQVDDARKGNWKILLTPSIPVPRDWFPENMAGLKVLCLASGGGQQGPIMAAAGADTTVYDYSPKQLGQDEMVAARDNLKIKIAQGDMCDLSVFSDGVFDLIIHPWSNGYVESVLPVWNEAYRVLKKGGSLLSGFGNPLEFIFDMKAMNEGRLEVRHSIPYSDLTSITKEELEELVLKEGEGIAFGHTLDDQIGGQVAAGFVITGFYEDIPGMDILGKPIKGSIVTKAVKT